MSTPEKTENPTVAVAKKRRANEDQAKTHILSTGVEVRLRPVSAALISEVTSSIKYPKVPKVFNEDKGRDEENPVHPDYLAAKQDVDNERGMAAMDAMAMFGVELIDGVPEDDRWLRNLKLLEKRGRLDFSGLDLTDEVDLEYLYKKHIAVSGADYALLGRLSGLTEEAISAAAESFRSN